MAFIPVGQVLGQINEEQYCPDIMLPLLSQYAEPLERVEAVSCLE